MEQLVKDTYDRVIMSKFIPAVIKVQRMWRSHREREKVRLQAENVLKLRRAFNLIEHIETRLAFSRLEEITLEKMRRKDYRMSQRIVKKEKLKH